MSEELKVVARTKKGEMLKGYAKSNDLECLRTNGSIYLRFANGSGNTVGAYICQDQLEGLYVVKTFEGVRPPLFKRMYHDIKRVMDDNASMISAAVVLAILSMAGLIALI